MRPLPFDVETINTSKPMFDIARATEDKFSDNIYELRLHELPLINVVSFGVFDGLLELMEG